MTIDRDLDRLAQIQPEERDYNMEMRLSDWGKGLDETRWSLKEFPARHFTRAIPIPGADGQGSELEEKILPFPSAPIYGINR
jgi:hypothetical protein